MNRCYKSVGGLLCVSCGREMIRYGKSREKQRYRCKSCKRTQMGIYFNKACNFSTNEHIVNYLKEGCGIRSIARLLAISASTVLRRIKRIADQLKKPVLSGGIYEVDELRTYIKNKNRECWIMYALDRESGHVAEIEVGNRKKMNLKKVTDTLLLAKCRKIYTDGLAIYRQIIPPLIHRTKRYGTNKIERKNLSLRTHLKRLSRKTICFSKSISMLEACLKIYFWHDTFYCHE